jgi:hypothetical protein
MEERELGAQVAIIPDSMDLWEVAVGVVRGKITLPPPQMRMLIEMFPYLRPKLSATAITRVDEKSFAAQLERCIERSKSPMRMINPPKTIEHEQLVSADELKRPFPRNYRRF